MIREKAALPTAFRQFWEADISCTLGFSSISHFSQRFKLEEGCSPLKYRKRVAQER